MFLSFINNIETGVGSKDVVIHSMSGLLFWLYGAKQSKRNVMSKIRTILGRVSHIRVKCKHIQRSRNLERSELNLFLNLGWNVKGD